MTLYEANMNSVECVKRFVDAATAVPYQIDVLSGGSAVDGKSIMDLFTLDLSRPVLLRLHAAPEETEAFATELKEFMTLAKLSEAD